MKTDLIETDFIIGALYAIVRGEGYHLLVYGGGETWYNGTRSDTPWGARPKSGDRVVKIDMEVPLENCGCAELERDIAKVFSITYGPEPKPFSPLPSIQMVQRTLGLPIGSKVEMPSPELIAGMTALAIFKAKLDHKPGATWSDGIRKMLAIPEARENILNPPSLELEVEKYREIKGPGVAKTTALIPQEYTLFRTTLGISERTGFELVLPVQVTPRGALVVFRAKENPLPVSIHGLWVIPPEAALRLCQKPSIETSDLPVVLQLSLIHI